RPAAREACEVRRWLPAEDFLVRRLEPADPFLLFERIFPATTSACVFARPPYGLFGYLARKNKLPTGSPRAHVHVWPLYNTNSGKINALGRGNTCNSGVSGGKIVKAWLTPGSLPQPRGA